MFVQVALVQSLARIAPILISALTFLLQSGASSDKDDTQRKFEQQRAEVIGESKENIKEAESTLKAKVVLAA